MKILRKNKIKFSIISTFVLTLVFIFSTFSTQAQFNKQINYQGKLTDSSGVAVADGDYNMNFWLLSSSTAATSTAIWSEARTGGNQVSVTNGLFSVMLGEVSSLDGLDFDQTLYLGVEIGGTSTPAWDGEMSPRKVLGAVPAAFVAETANTFAGLATTSFLRSDDSDIMEATSSSAILTIIQNGAGKLISLFSGATEMFTILNNGNVGIATTTPDNKLTVVGNSYLDGNLTITGNAAIAGTLADSSNASGTAGQILSSTGTGTDWISTSGLGLGDGTFLGLTDTISSYTANRLLFTNSGANGVTDDEALTFDGTNFGLGTTTGIAWNGTRYLYASSTNDSIVFGENAGASFDSNTTYNVALGFEAGRYASSTTLFSGNNFIGQYAGYNNTGSYNNIIGRSAGFYNSGINNNLFGYMAGLNNTGNYNEMIGYQTGFNLQATSSVVIGGQAFRGGAGTTIFQAVNNTALGYSAGYAAQTGASNNILLGYRAADNLTTGANNIIIGYDVDIASTTGSNQLNIGNLIFGTGIDGTGTTLSSGNIGIGTTTPSSKLTVVGDTFITGAIFDSTNASGTAGQILSSTGTGTDWISTSGLGLGDGTFLGLTDTISSYTANRLLFTNSGGTGVTDSSNLTFDGTNLGLGSQSYLAFGGTNYLYASSTNGSILFGQNAGATFNNQTLVNVAIGYEAGRYASTTDADYNNYIGASAGLNNTGLSNNIFGYFAGTNNTGANNNIFGASAGANNTGDSNNIYGQSAGYNNTGTSNNFIGRLSGYNNTGNYNEMIGYSTGLYIQSTSSVLVGAESFYGGSIFQAVNNTALGYRAGYAAQTGASNNIFLGYQAADNLTTGANNIVIGYDVDIASTTGSNQLNIGNLIFGTGIDGTGTTLSSGNIGIGTTTPEARLAIEKLNYSEAGVAGLDQYFSFTNNTASAIQYANRSYIYATNTATTTMVGSMLRLNDSTSYGNIVRGLEVQTDEGTNTLGENTALSGFARTFGVRGVTSGDAGGSYEPAGVFAETGGSTQGNAIRGYSSTITSAALLKLFQDTSAFTGTGLLMNFGNSGGSFSSTTASKFIDLQNAGTSMFTVDPYGMLTIGNGTTTQNAGIQVGYGGICVDNDGSCNASTTGRISAVSYHTGNSDLAEMYFSKEILEPGDVIYTKGGLSIGRADSDNKNKIIGVVSTKPGLLLGFDDRSLNKGETGYPVALSGRVPIKLSNENGEIKAGDELMLSSVPGVAMKATSTGRIIGVALEDFDETKAYSKTYINQFGDDLIDSVFVPQKQNDPKQNDGCYNSGGGNFDEAECVHSDYENEDLETEAIVLYEDELEALAQLAKKSSQTVVIENGQIVNVGQAIVFVDIRHRYIDDIQLAVIDGLKASASSTVGVSEETVWERLVQLANNFVDGVLSVLKLKADKVEVKDELCVDGVCVDGDDLRKLLEQSQSQDNGTVETNKSSGDSESVDQKTEDKEVGNNDNKKEDDYIENVDEEVVDGDEVGTDINNSSSTSSTSNVTDNYIGEGMVENPEIEVKESESTSTLEVDTNKKSPTQDSDVGQNKIDTGQGKDNIPISKNEVDEEINNIENIEVKEESPKIESEKEVEVKEEGGKEKLDELKENNEDIPPLEN
ncbi:MAG: hypothetical protein R3B60_00010 [Candidatus Paceibacterota bacterium]